MNDLFGVLALIVFVMWLGMGLIWFRYMKKLPVFWKNDNSNNHTIYPPLSVIIPACNEEESIEQAVTQLISQDYPSLEIVLVNDRSTDQTGAILEDLKVKYPQLKVITIFDLPPNWLGKNHAVYQGVKEATGEWLLLTDADIMFSPDSLKKAVSYASEHTLDHLTIAPNFLVKSILGNALTAYVMLAITFLAIFGKSVGIGAFNLIKRSVYQEIGGYEAIPLQPVDDMSLGKLVIQKGYKQGFGFSKQFITVRGYENISATFKGLEKNQFAGVNYSVLVAMGSCFSMLLLHVYPFVGLFFGSIWARTLCGFSVLTVFAVYSYLAKYIDTSRFYVLFHPISALVYIGIVINSTVKTLSRGGIEWRGTFYPLEELKKHNG
ncbi:glycosyl transferase [Desulfosporosinus orientis DSM 765]|uniref:Glycosyl transferase n=1 Tax=Desulfosporosinus orientis (strain ATCC 19365 / DSM 765 / NCIMB 8382 / VKM B-1628 / Singapore I) TaxID=768706 RepID=G7W8K3_DESOD|nr:glycosyltransferase family 2 protein [Desulfosporosinus orientis]AET67430.1 glycosyl transferase [Desulfosporosinus orientis DSM 765]